MAPKDGMPARNPRRVNAAGSQKSDDRKLADFAEYVEQKQIEFRNLSNSAASTDAMGDISELVAQLGLSGAEDTSTLRNLLLGGSAEPIVEGKGKAKDEFDPVDFKKRHADLCNHISNLIETGRGETVFELGAEANGTDMKLTHDELYQAFARLKMASNCLNAEATILIEHKGTNLEGFTAKVLIRRKPQNIDEVLEIRIAVVGNVDAGKSTMLGVLTKGVLDDGRGKARVNLFRHKHEFETGRTSSVGMEMMGFDASGKVVSSEKPGRKLDWKQIGERSSKYMSFTDLAGHEKYLRTTVFGLLGTMPDYVMLMISANNGVIGMSKEHLGIAVALNVPILIVVTKIDMTPKNITDQTIAQISKILKSPGARKVPFFIKSMEDVYSSAQNFYTQRVTPIFQVSNVTGDGLDYIRNFLNVLPYRGNFNKDAPFEFHVNDTFSVPFVGTVVSGVVKTGVIHAGDNILIGPDSLGNFMSSNIKSIERKRTGVPTASAGQSASFAIRKIRRRDVRKGMVALPVPADPKDWPKAHREFIAEVMILSHATTIKPKYQAMLHVGPVSQTCAIIDIDRPYIRTGDKATVAFRFVQRPEYMTLGDKLIFREGRTKGLGSVKALGYDPKKPLGGLITEENKENEKDAVGTETNKAPEAKRVAATTSTSSSAIDANGASK